MFVFDKSIINSMSFIGENIENYMSVERIVNGNVKFIEYNGISLKCFLEREDKLHY